jgi:hypothetical protein
MLSKKIFSLIIVGLVFIFLFTFNISAQEIKENNADLNERIELIQASKKISEEKENKMAAQSGISLYVTNFHTDETEYKLGGKYEQLISESKASNSLNNLSLSYVIEGIYLEGESTSLAGFLSIKTTFNNRMFSPYLGVGAEFMGVANYQGFIGLNIIDNNFFVETKFINDKDEWDSGNFYSVVGFTINL